MAAKHWISSAIAHPGALTATSKRAGKTVAQYVANPPAGISSTTKRRIALAKTLKKLRRKKT